jgi:hypothetical protein
LLPVLIAELRPIWREPMLVPGRNSANQFCVFGNNESISVAKLFW